MLSPGPSPNDAAEYIKWVVPETGSSRNTSAGTVPLATRVFTTLPGNPVEPRPTENSKSRRSQL